MTNYKNISILLILVIIGLGIKLIRNGNMSEDALEQIEKIENHNTLLEVYKDSLTIVKSNLTERKNKTYKVIFKANSKTDSVSNRLKREFKSETKRYNSILSKQKKNFDSLLIEAKNKNFDEQVHKFKGVSYWYITYEKHGKDKDGKDDILSKGMITVELKSSCFSPIALNKEMGCDYKKDGTWVFTKNQIQISEYEYARYQKYYSVE